MKGRLGTVRPPARAVSASLRHPRQTRIRARGGTGGSAHLLKLLLLDLRQRRLEGGAVRGRGRIPARRPRGGRRRAHQRVCAEETDVDAVGESVRVLHSRLDTRARCRSARGAGRGHSLPSRRRSEWRGWRTRRRISSSASVTSGESHAAPRTRPPRVRPAPPPRRNDTDEKRTADTIPNHPPTPLY